MSSLRVLCCVLLLASFGCAQRTLIVKVPTPPRKGATFSCELVDPSAQSTTNPALQNSCLRKTENSDPQYGVPDNHPNTRYVYTPPSTCDQMYEVRIYDPGSDDARVTVTCDKSLENQ